jgi:hypothetical protein
VSFVFCLQVQQAAPLVLASQQAALVLALLLVARRFGPVGLVLLGLGALVLLALLPGGLFSLLGLAFRLLALVAGHRASGFLHLALGLLRHTRPPDGCLT